WIFAHARTRRHLVLPGHAHALAFAVKAQSMVAALELVSDQTAQRQGRQAMRATVGERNGLARGRAEQHDLLAAHGAGERGPADLVAKGDNLPAVTQPHGVSSAQIVACRRRTGMTSAARFGSARATLLSWEARRQGMARAQLSLLVFVA